MQKLKRFLLFVAFCILGILVGGFTGYRVAVRANNGYYTNWQLLNGPQKFIRIEESISYIVWAQASDGKLYSYSFNYQREAEYNKWIEVKEIPKDLRNAGEMEMQKSTSCKSQIVSPQNLPGNVIECARGWFAGPEYGVVTYYALLDDGSIWAWYQSSSMIREYILPLLFAFLGLYIGVIAFVVFMIIRHIRRKRAFSSSSAPTV